MVQGRQVKRARSRTRMPRKERPERPEVIIDFVFEDGLLFIAVANIGERPAFKVSVSFDEKIVGAGGAEDVSALPLFQNIEFLAPHKTIRTFLDTSESYFHRGQPTRIKAGITCQDANRKRYRTSIQHDLRIYQGIGSVRRLGWPPPREGAGQPGSRPSD